MSEWVSESESQQCHSPVERGVTSNSQAPTLVEEEAPFQNTQKKSWVPTGPEIEKNCAGEDQQQLLEYAKCRINS
jgi:hypothetical protein